MNNRIKIILLGMVAIACTVIGIITLKNRGDDDILLKKDKNAGITSESADGASGGDSSADGFAAGTASGGDSSADGFATGEASNGASSDRASSGGNSKASGSGSGNSSGNASGNASSQDVPNGSDKISSGGDSKEEPREIVVFVCGEVNCPGVYTFREGDRVVDAVLKAGGLTENADVFFVNQADLLTDASKLYFPNKEEAKELPSGSYVTYGTGAETKAGTDSKAGTDGKSGQVAGLVNINTATKEELMTLPGVGESKADSIIDYRNSVGPFSCIEDIMNITGIKEGLFGKIREKITV